MSTGETDSEHPPSDQRPLGVSILSVLYLFGAVFVLVVLYLVVADVAATRGWFFDFNKPQLPEILIAVFRAAFFFVVGIGLWFGTKWSWWFQIFLNLDNLVRTVLVIFMASSTVRDFEVVVGNSERSMLDYVQHIGVQLFILQYVFNQNVLNFFGLEAVQKKRAISIALGFAVAVNAALIAAVYFRLIS